MKKILIVVIALAFIWAIPSVRAKVSAKAVPVLERLGPVGAAVLNPARRYATQNEVVGIARLMKDDQQEGRPLPGENDNFTDWLRRRIVHEDGKDVWGNPFWYRLTGITVQVGSSGPDGKRGTRDDVTHTTKF
jgi:hypothetical protein